MMKSNRAVVCVCMYVYDGLRCMTWPEFIDRSFSWDL